MTTIALARPPILCRVTAWKCSTITSVFCAMLCGCSFMKRASACAAFLRSTLRVVLAGLEQPEVGRVGGVVLQHVEDELLLDRLPHRVAVRRLPIAAEHGERLVLGRGGEGEEAQVRLPAALGHAPEELLHVVAAFLGRALPGLLAQALRRRAPP